MSKFFVVLFCIIFSSSHSYSSDQERYDFGAVTFDKKCQSRNRLSISGVTYKNDTYIQTLRYPEGSADIKTTITNKNVTTKIRGIHILSAKTETEYLETLGLMNVTVTVRHDEGVCKYYYQAALKEDAVSQSNEDPDSGFGSAH